jgi:hypothetical protein
METVIENLVYSSCSKDGSYPGNDNISIVFVQIGSKVCPCYPPCKEGCSKEEEKKIDFNLECICFPECVDRCILLPEIPKEIKEVDKFCVAFPECEGPCTCD